jgi:two-component system LytT family response regulator
MIKAILIDDEAHCLDSLSILLNEYCPTVQIIEKCSSPEQGFAAIKDLNPDLVILDIDMPGMNGFELLDQFQIITFAVIFVTGHDQYAIRAIHLSALDYLLKPVNPQELIKSVNKVQTRRQLPTTEQLEMLLKQLIDKDYQPVKIAVSTLEGFEMIPAEQVIRCEAFNNYTRLYLKENKKITASRTLKEIEHQLHNFPFFFRVHHSYIVNLNEVVRYVRGEGGHLVMSDGSTVNVSRSRKEALLKLF